MAAALDVTEVLRHYHDPLARGRLEPLGSAGGFSGTRLWRLVGPHETHCVRCWPDQYPDQQRLRYIHRCLRHAWSQGCRFIPVPVATRSGESFVQVAGRLWQVEPWLPGRSDYAQRATRTRLCAAMTKLAQFHIAAASLDTRSDRKVSPGLPERLALINQIQQGDRQQLEHRLRSPFGSDPLREQALEVLALFPRAATAVAEQIHQAEPALLPLQPCIRDIWHGNVLFYEDDVTGFVDFGSMRPETVAADVARLLGSMAEDDAELWTAGLDAYESIRPLAEPERRCIAVFDASGVLLSGLNWLRWIYLDQRHFADLAAVRERLVFNCKRLRQLVARIEMRGRPSVD